MLNKYKIEFEHQFPEKWTRAQWIKVVDELKSTIEPETMFNIMEAANFVGHKYNLPDGAISSLGQKMMDAVGNDLIVRDPKDKIPFIPEDKVRCYYEQVRADELDEWFKSKNVEYRIQSEVGSGVNKISTINIKEMWVAEAWKQGELYMTEWRKAGYEPTIENIGLYVEGVFSNNGTHNTSGNVIDRATIVREALTGITRHKKGYKSKFPKIPDGKVGQLPEK